MIFPPQAREMTSILLLRQADTRVYQQQNQLQLRFWCARNGREKMISHILAIKEKQSSQTKTHFLPLACFPVLLRMRVIPDHKNKTRAFLKLPSLRF